MLTDVTQRWRRHRDSYRPRGEPVDPSRYEVAKLDDDNTPKAFVREHHYSGSYPAARYRYGLYELPAELVGVAVFSIPAQPRSLDVLPCERAASVELGRFVLLDRIPANAESWFIGQCHRLLRREGIRGVVSFSDPVPREKADGGLVFRGHIGTIYQAVNATYLGRSKAEIKRLLPDGTVMHGRALAKIRRRDQGYRYAAQILEAHGAEPLADEEDARDWLDRWLGKLTRPLRHGGNHKYAWGLTRLEKRHLPAGLPYPKATVCA